MDTDRHVVLIGLPGAGKTSTGRHLAKLLQRPFADADEQVELTAGCTIPELVRTHGDVELHRREGQTLGDLLKRYSPLVISAPGAVEIGDENRALLAASAVVLWLRGPIGLLTDLGNPAHRPRLADGHHEALTRLERELSGLYQDVADHIVEIDPFHTHGDEPKEAIARHILGLLATGDLQGTVRIPEASLSPPTDVDLEPDQAALYEEVADHIVDIDPFHANEDDPDRAVVRHILTLLARHGLHPIEPK